tara:strand:+ start:547 stop:690 length:144 start_codon:yes stop_codon:yes gene_type:complete
MRIDLHTHTTASDGKLSPKELIDAALKERLDVIGITTEIPLFNLSLP